MVAKISEAPSGFQEIQAHFALEKGKDIELPISYAIEQDGGANFQ